MMRTRTIFLLTASVVLTGLLGYSVLASKASTYQKMEDGYQRDADHIRAVHLMEWAALIDEYHDKTGHYPLSDRQTGEEPVLVQIMTKEQQEYFDPNNKNYKKKMDNKGKGFKSVSVHEFVSEIERELGRDIDERYDPQRVTTTFPNYLSYFAKDGDYLIWTVCVSCPSTSNSFSTLIWTGTPTINIGSGKLLKEIPKTFTIETLKENKEFAAFMKQGPVRPAWFLELEKRQKDENKNP